MGERVLDSHPDMMRTAPEYRAAYEALEAEFDLVDVMIGLLGRCATITCTRMRLNFKTM